METTILLTASWCGPCHMLKNKMIADKVSADQVIDIDDIEAMETVKKYKVSSVPTLLVVENDILVEKVQGIEDILKCLKSK